MAGAVGAVESAKGEACAAVAVEPAKGGACGAVAVEPAKGGACGAVAVSTSGAKLRDGSKAADKAMGTPVGALAVGALVGSLAAQPTERAPVGEDGTEAEGVAWHAAGVEDTGREEDCGAEGKAVGEVVVGWRTCLHSLMVVLQAHGVCELQLHGALQVAGEAVVGPARP